MHGNDDINTRLSFLRLDENAKNHLKQIKPEIDRVLPKALDGFYRHIASYATVNDMFPDQGVKDHAKSAQARHWDLISSGNFDGRYVESVRRIGLAHHQLGLEPRWYLGGYAFILTELAASLSDYLNEIHPGPEMAETRKEYLGAAIKSAFLDMDFAISVYLEEGEKEKSEAMETMAASFEEGIGGFINNLTNSIGELQSASESMSQSANVTSQRSTNVAAAVEEATSNVGAIASAVEEMSQSIREISGQVNNSADVTRRVANRAKDTNESVQSLVEASEKIGNVVGLIKEVADQTNLLALNATIEAARAGEAGRGFAVVASEVKALANQTASATEDIRKLVQEMQKATGSSATSLREISTEIMEVDELSTAIAAAVEQQSAATNEIARNTQEASKGTQMVAESITQVQTATSETGNVAEQVLSSASHLADQSTKLQDQVREFLVKVRAA